MRYTELKVGDKEYKLRLTAGGIVNAEKKMGGNILDIFTKKERIPAITELLTVLQSSLQKFHNGITLSDAYDIYDEYIDEGGTFEDLIEKIIDVFEVSGFFKKDQVKEGEGILKAKE